MDLSSLIAVGLDRNAFASDTGELLDEIEQATYRALNAAARRTEHRARTDHWYQNRTNTLRDGSLAVPADGEVWGNDARSYVTIPDVPYAKYVNARGIEKGYGPILDTAYYAVARDVEAEVLSLFAEAVAR